MADSAPFRILETDRLFSDSPQEGDPECVCSRCGLVIPEEEVAIRAWPMRNAGPQEAIGEWRFHPACLGIETFPEDYDPGFDLPQEFTAEPEEFEPDSNDW